MTTDNNPIKQNVRHLMLDLQQMKQFCEKPLVIKDAKGIYLTDIDGKRYIDGVSGIYVVNVGHGNEHVIEAIRKQQEKVSFVAPLHGVSDTAVRYAKKLAEVTPEGMNTFKLVSGGSEATESAIKFARQYHHQTGNSSKYKIISNYTAFHGGTMGALSATGLSGSRKDVFGPFLSGFVHLPPPYCFRCPYGLTSPPCCMLCANMLEYTIQREGPDSIAAMMDDVHRFRVEWGPGMIDLYLNGTHLESFSYAGRVQPLQYVFLGRDNVYGAQVGPVYSNLCLTGAH